MDVGRVRGRHSFPHPYSLFWFTAACRSSREADLPDRPATRVYTAEPLAPGAEVALAPEQAHKLRNVLRLGDGTAVAAFNGGDGEWLCRILEIGRRGAALRVERQLRPAVPEGDLWLLFAPIRRSRLDWLVEKATELGVAALQPVWTERTQPERLNRERLRALVIAAAEQSERLDIPAIRDAAKLDALLPDWPPERRLFVCDETGAGTPVAAALAAFPAPAPAALLIGPEGGFADAELDALGKLSIVTRIGLGPRVLRAETAAVAALAAFQAIAGDWRRIRPR